MNKKYRKLLDAGKESVEHELDILNLIKSLRIIENRLGINLKQETQKFQYDDDKDCTKKVLCIDSDATSLEESQVGKNKVGANQYKCKKKKKSKKKKSLKKKSDQVAELEMIADEEYGKLEYGEINIDLPIDSHEVSNESYSSE